MSDARDSTSELETLAEQLREQSANLVRQAERLDQLSSSIRAAATESGEQHAELDPLPNPQTDDEASARIVALDLASRDVEREVASRVMLEQFPAVDGEALLDRFYRG